MKDFKQLTRVKVDCNGPLWTVTVNRPDQDNALDSAANQELNDVFDAFEEDAAATVAILTSKGNVFGLEREQGSEEPASLPAGGYAGLTNRTRCVKPVIAAVNGDAFDEAFETILACDLIIADEHARFGFRKREAGRASFHGGEKRLLHRLPHYRAMEVLLCGTMLSAREGVLLGFVNEIATRREVLKVAVERAQKIAAMPRDATFAIKQAVLEHGG